MDSSDDWCYVDSESGSVRSPSFDAAEPDVELEPMVVEEVVKAKTASAWEEESRVDAEVLEMLQDNTTRTKAFSREAYLAMLEPSHRRRVLTGLQADAKQVSRKRTVREVFATPSARLYEKSAFVDRFRASFPSYQSLPYYSAVEETAVKPFTKDQGVQTEPSTVASPSCDRLSELSSALERSLNLSTQLTSKCSDLERSNIRAIHLQNRLDQSLYENRQLSKQLRSAERGLQISRKRSELTDEYQDHLKREIERLRDDNNALSQRLEVLAGGLDVDSKSIDELEDLEDKLDRAMANVRESLRMKYRAASGMDTRPSTSSESSLRKNSEEYCVVCMAKLKCVRLDPCGHEVLCSECALRVTSCPIDRQLIQGKVLTHGTNAYSLEK